MGFDNPVAIGGAPLAGQPFLLYNVSPVSLAAGTPLTLTATDGTTAPDVSGAVGYDIVISPFSGMGSTFPFATIRLQWFDQAAANAVAEEDWTIPLFTPVGPPAPPGFVRGSAQMRGQLLQVVATNLDSVAGSLSVALYETSRPQTGSDWRHNPQLAVGSFLTPTAGVAFDNCLGTVSNVTVAHGTTKSYLLGLFAGNVYVRGVASGAADNTKVSFRIKAMEDTSGFNTLMDQQSGAGGSFNQFLNFPRAVCRLDIVNNDGANDAQAFFIAAAQPIA